MELLGKYNVQYLVNDNAPFAVYSCKNLVPLGQSPTTGFVLFESEQGMRIYQAKPDLSVYLIKQLIVEQWSKLPEERRKEFDRRAIEINRNKGSCCGGRLSFRQANDRVQMSADELIDYKLHSAS